MNKKPKDRVSVRLDRDTRTKLQLLAAADKRDEGNYIRKILWEHVEKVEKDSRPPMPVPEHAKASESLASTNGGQS